MSDDRRADPRRAGRRRRTGRSRDGASRRRRRTPPAAHRAHRDGGDRRRPGQRCFGGVAVAAWVGGEPFLAVMGGIGCLMTAWVGGLTLFRG